MTTTIFLVILTAGLTYAVTLFFNRTQLAKLATKLKLVEQELDHTQSELRKRSQAFNEELTAQSEAMTSELLKIRDQHRKMLDEREDAYRTALRKLEDESIQAGFKRSENMQAALQVTVHPFIRKTKSSSLFSDTTTCEIGYQYQLMVHGIPCLKPHIHIESEETYKDFNNERLAMLTNTAKQIAMAAINSKNPAIRFDEQPIITEAKS